MALKVEYFSLSPADATNQYISLSGVPVDATVALDIISGTAQLFGTGASADFTVDGTKVKWDGMRLADSLAAGDELRVVYDRS